MANIKNGLWRDPGELRCPTVARITTSSSLSPFLPRPHPLRLPSPPLPSSSHWISHAACSPTPQFKPIINLPHQSPNRPLRASSSAILPAFRLQLYSSPLDPSSCYLLSLSFPLAQSVLHILSLRLPSFAPSSRPSSTSPFLFSPGRPGILIQLPTASPPPRLGCEL